MSALRDYFVYASKELSQVKWPTKRQLVEYTSIVLLFTLVLAGFLAVVDWGLALPLKALTGGL